MAGRKLLDLVLIGLLTVAALEVAAHPGHDDALTERQAVMRGKAIVRNLLKNGTEVQGEVLDSRWEDFSGRETCSASPLYYLVKLENHAAGRTMHILLNHSGKFLRARFDEGFAELIFSNFPMQECVRYL